MRVCSRDKPRGGVGHGARVTQATALGPCAHHTCMHTSVLALGSQACVQPDDRRVPRVQRDLARIHVMLLQHGAARTYRTLHTTRDARLRLYFTRANARQGERDRRERQRQQKKPVLGTPTLGVYARLKKYCLQLSPPASPQRSCSALCEHARESRQGHPGIHSRVCTPLA
ncbi:hypothetical protein MRX96_036950 [Rhipicephalus microplus]